MQQRMDWDNFSLINYKAIELLAQLNCLKPSENLISKTESLLKSILSQDNLISSENHFIGQH